VINLNSLRAALRALRHTPDRIAHPFRRRLLMTALAQQKPARRIMFICHGNICRSPYAAVSFKRLAAGSLEGLTVLSAGFIGPTRASPEAAIRVASQLGVDLTAHRSTVLSRELTAEAELFAVMDGHQRRLLHRLFGVPYDRIIVLGDLDSDPIDTRRIRDPVDRPDEEFHSSYQRIDRCLQTLLRALKSADLSVRAR
jgi:protein-tyrosine phosphatase